MKVNGAVVDKVYGVVLVALCIAFTIFSVKFCDGDITPIFVLIPIGMCALTEDKKLYKAETKRRK